ncbi:FAD-dependent monooxygenase [Aquincola sp. S2]|uniref:FAD-dependent monooxygenase n=1 Tax=Pseudaquabacterium terrae TaxID=2732868 RepID=A0ABX2EDU7_9BURK|nr:FAD-dependent monooxygenase [Aquabacterium terrae]NRF66780.1 FAD-dependent monooxygenase [Aquabacterium terrae]
MDSVDVSIRGSGPVAFSLGLALARQGLRVALPQVPPLAAAGDLRAYALNAAARALLSSLRVWDALPADAVTPVYDMHVEGDGAGGALDFSSWQQGVEALAWIVDAAELERALHTAARFAPHLALDSGEVRATLTVLAEGKDSAAREALGVAFERHAYGQIAVAARLRADRPHGGVARQWFRSPDVLALLPLDRPQRESSYALVWSLPAERARALLDADDAAFEQALAEASGGAAGTLQLAGARAGWPLAIARAERLCGPGWVLVGDAAHVVHPLAGQGLNLGLGDVAALARVLAEREPWRSLGDEVLLRRYARERALPTRAMAQLTDGLLHLFAQPQPLVRELRNRGMTLLNHFAPLKRLLTSRALDA